MGTNFQVVSIEIVWITIHIRSFWLKWFHIYFFFYHSSNSLYSAVNTGWFCCFAFISIYKLNVKRKVCNDAGDSFSHITMAKICEPLQPEYIQIQKRTYSKLFCFPTSTMNSNAYCANDMLASVSQTHKSFLFVQKISTKEKIGIWKFYL